MDKEVLIHVRGLQTMDADGEQEPLEIVVPGQYYFRNGSHYLRYEEVMEDFAEPTVNYIKISRKGMEVRKKGVVNVHMVFEQGKKNMTYYTTPYGTIEMGIAATNLNLQESDGGLDMKVDYALDMNQEHVADCYLAIKAQPKDCKNFTSAVSFGQPTRLWEDLIRRRQIRRFRRFCANLIRSGKFSASLQISV